MFKRRTSIRLSILFFLLCLIPMGKMAYASDVKYQGSCGDLTYTIDTEGVLTISGEGDYELSDYESWKEVPCWFQYRNEIKKAVVNVREITSTRRMFHGCDHLTEINFEDFDTSKVTDMSYMFCACERLTELDLSGFSTVFVKNMANMFDCCYSLQRLDLSSFVTDSLVDMREMFIECINLRSIDLSSFHTEKVTDMGHMFYECNKLESLDLSSFDTGNVKYMTGMFESCGVASLDLSNFDTGSVINMGAMFSECGVTSLDLTSFDTSNVINMSFMFENCQNLESVDLSSFSTERVTDMADMFAYCRKLKTLDLSNFSFEQVSDMEAMFQTCENLSADICFNGRPIYWGLLFSNAATAKDAKILISYDGDCDRELALRFVNTKSPGSHVYLKEVSKVTGLEVSNATDGIKLSWDKQEAADGYQVYRKAEGESSYKRIRTTKEISYMDTALTDGVKYSYKVKSYISENEGKTYGSYSSVKSIYRLSRVKLTKINNVRSGVKLTFDTVKGADGYYVYRKLKGGSYKRIATIKSKETNVYTDQTAVDGKLYLYQLAAFKESDRGSRSASAEICFLKAPDLVNMTSPEKGKLKLSWKRKDGIDGYQIRVSDHDDFSGVLKKTTLEAERRSQSFTVASGKVWYGKIRSFKKVGDKIYYSAFSKLGSVKVK